MDGPSVHLLQHQVDRSIHVLPRLCARSALAGKNGMADAAEVRPRVPHSHGYTRAEHRLYPGRGVAPADLGWMEIDRPEETGLDVHAPSVGAVSDRSRAISSAENTLSMSRIMMKHASRFPIPRMKSVLMPVPMRGGGSI